jgi:hypothetical protein
MKKYFVCYDYFSEYDEPILDEKSILNIPALSVILPIAWITGADVYVYELDENYANSMNKMQAEYKKIYPKAPLKTKLIVKKLVNHKDNTEDNALLFSGGVDSTHTLFANINLKPRLIMIFGVMDIPIENTEFQQQIKSRYLEFAKQEGLTLNLIHSNALNIMNHDRLRHLWGRYQERHEGDYWNGIGYSLGHICQVAPLSINRFNNLLFASSYDATHSIIENPDASSPETDEKIKWANLQVRHDCDLHRFEKVKTMKQLLTNNRITLRVCNSKHLLPDGLMNCSKCEKCLRTIASLAYTGVDPNKCGFNVYETTFDLMKFLFTNKILTKKNIKIWWKPLQQAIPEHVENDFYGSRNFFEWFRDINLDYMGKTYRTVLYSTYFMLPFNVSFNMKKLLERFSSPKHLGYQSN